MTLSEPTAYHHEQNYSATDRKTLGIHYTPDSIVDYIVRQTLAPCFKSPDFLLKIKILDPACGSGLFLLKAFDILAEASVGCISKASYTFLNLNHVTLHEF